MKYFRLEEFDCKHCGKNKMDTVFLEKIDKLRGAYRHPLLVTSGYRCPEHNSAVSSTGVDGPHTTGHAADFGVSRGDAFRLLEIAFALGCFTGVGVQQKGASRFIHLDDLTTPPRPNVWSY